MGGNEGGREATPTSISIFDSCDMKNLWFQLVICSWQLLKFTSLASHQQYWTEFEKILSFVHNRISDYLNMKWIESSYYISEKNVLIYIELHNENLNRLFTKKNHFIFTNGYFYRFSTKQGLYFSYKKKLTKSGWEKSKFLFALYPWFSQEHACMP